MSDGGALSVSGKMYHVREKWDATTLKFEEDGTFRWVVHGCDFGGGDIGRWTIEDGAIVLRPHSDRDHFRWPGEYAIESVVRLTVRIYSDGLETNLGLTEGTYVQFWKPGGRCAQCGGGAVLDGGSPLGPSGSYACDDPFEDASIDY